MKLNRTYLFIVISSIALLIVLIIQVNWILETAKMKEKLFNEKANIVLSKTAEALSLDKEACKNLQISTGKNEVHKIDSLFNHYMNLYSIHIDYSFEVKPIPVALASLSNYATGKQDTYQTCIGGDSEDNNLELKLVFPEKKQYILAEMGTPFITSVILIIVVLVMSWRTILSLLKEKRIAEHTTDFLNNMTHEFKTPLTNIALAGKMMSKDSNSIKEEKIKHYTGIILEENEKLKLQVEEVLSMTALERGEIPLQKTELDFHQLIQSSLKRINMLIESTGTSVELNLAAARSMILGDQTHLTNALCNLFDNAVKYANGIPKLSIQAFNASHKLVVIISDKGLGIEKEYQKKVFEKFFRVPTGDVHNAKGFGIGLAYVKAIIELHKGTIELKSEKGKGTSFTITLPNA
jgi:two-component system, OmpR family, phosphate regulon sensor histidine kinase PhoR